MVSGWRIARTAYGLDGPAGDRLISPGCGGDRQRPARHQHRRAKDRQGRAPGAAPRSAPGPRLPRNGGGSGKRALPRSATGITLMVQVPMPDSNNRSRSLANDDGNTSADQCQPRFLVTPNLRRRCRKAVGNSRLPEPHAVSCSAEPNTKSKARRQHRCFVVASRIFEVSGGGPNCQLSLQFANIFLMASDMPLRMRRQSRTFGSVVIRRPRTGAPTCLARLSAAT